MWSINGDELASINTATQRHQHITCLAMSSLMEWDARNVIITGSSDGVVRVREVERDAFKVIVPCGSNCDIIRSVIICFMHHVVSCFTCGDVFQVWSLEFVEVADM